MSKIFTPTNQIRLTNVAVVRLKKAGKRFEIACYKNKVISWRNNIEKDLDEVLQTNTIFGNVSKGQAAKKDDITKAFGTLSEIDICKEILAKGELQVSEKERQASHESVFNSVANSVANMCVNPETKRPYTVSMIEKFLKEAHFSIKPNKNAKQQTLEAIKLLKENNIAIERSRMKLKVSLPAKDNAKVKEHLLKLSAQIESEEFSGNTAIFHCLIDPGHYREVEELVKKESNRKGLVELIELREAVEETEDLE